MVQTMFETYNKYRDSVYYDASAWSVGNFYNMKYSPVTALNLGAKITSTDEIVKPTAVQQSDYAYIIDWDDYNAPAALNFLQSNGIVASAAFKPFTAKTNQGNIKMNYGALVIAVSLQKPNAKEVYKLIQQAEQRFNVPIYATRTGYNASGIDLGSRSVTALKRPKAAMLIGNGIRSYEAGEVWHLLDTRVHMPITKIPMRNFNRANIDKYNTLVMVSGRYSFTEKQQAKIKDWVNKGNTLITIGTASKWAIDKNWLKKN